MRRGPPPFGGPTETGLSDAIGCQKARAYARIAWLRAQFDRIFNRSRTGYAILDSLLRQSNRGDAGLAHEGLRQSIPQCDVPKGR